MEIASDPIETLRYFYFYNMTLKEFIEENKLNLNSYDRAKLGHRLRFLKPKFVYVPEKDYFVRDYQDNFFDRQDVQLLIIKYMTNG